MRNIYLFVIVFLIVSAILFFGSFVYLDKVNHNTRHYSIQHAGKDIGTIKVDRFITADKIIYKSVTSLPFEPLYTEYRSRLVLDRNYKIESYTKERIAGRASDSIYLENFKNLVSFVTRYQSKFIFAENIPIKRETFVFEDDSPMTYLPIIENYNFSTGRSQGFSAISFIQQWNMPPMKRFIILTSIKDEYLKIGRRKIKCENLILKMRDFPQGAIWVGKSDRSIMKIDLPARNINIIRTFGQKTLKAVNRIPKGGAYLTKELSFKSKGVDLTGTLTLPEGEGRFPAVLLSPGAGPLDRDYQGLFASIADYLSKNGFACFRYDKRGIGSSDGDASSSTSAGDIDDLGSALQCIIEQRSVDPDKIVIIGHGKGAVAGLKVASKNSNVKGIIMMSPSLNSSVDGIMKRDGLDLKARKSKWSDDYLDLVLKASQESHAKVAGSTGDWAYILGKRCFLGAVREDITNEQTPEAIDIQAPVLILQGKDSDEIYGDTAVIIDKMLAGSGKTQHTLTYYAYLGPFFGTKIADYMHRSYYDTDKEVLENIRSWLYNTLADKPATLV